MDFREIEFNKHREFTGKISQVSHIKGKRGPGNFVWVDQLVCKCQFSQCKRRTGTAMRNQFSYLMVFPMISNGGNKYTSIETRSD